MRSKLRAANISLFNTLEETEAQITLLKTLGLKRRPFHLGTMGFSTIRIRLFKNFVSSNF